MSEFTACRAGRTATQASARPVTDTSTRTWREWSCAVSVTVAEHRAGQVDRAAQIVAELMEQVDQAASRFRADSELEQINTHSGVLVPVSPLTFHLVTVALDAARDSGGAVDPTIGHALIDSGYDDQIDVVRARTGVPSMLQAETGPRALMPSWRSVRRDPTWCRVGVPAGVRLDLGATAKAWTADEAARRIHRSLGTPALVAIGGDLAVAGTPGADWRVDVAETEATLGTGEAERIGLHHGGIATSSTLGRCWGEHGERHHIIDPRTGRPAESGIRAATVWAPTALQANVMSTWLLVSPESALARLPRSGFGARVVSASGEVSRLGSWPGEQRWVA